MLLILNYKFKFLDFDLVAHVFQHRAGAVLKHIAVRARVEGDAQYFLFLFAFAGPLVVVLVRIAAAARRQQDGQQHAEQQVPRSQPRTIVNTFVEK